MRNFYIIGGAMGVGKTTVCRRLQQTLPNCPSAAPTQYDFEGAPHAESYLL